MIKKALAKNSTVQIPTVEFYDLTYKLPVNDQTVLDLYYNKKINQKDLAKIIGVTQGAISHRLTRIKERLVYLKKLEAVDFDKLFEAVLEVIDDPFDMLVLQSLIKTSCQSETAWQLNSRYDLKGEDKLNQIKVKHRFDRIVDKIKRKKKHREHYRTLRLIQNSYYMLHEVKLPQFEKDYYGQESH